ncbi:hypothetical protein GCM10028857_01310 [Salinarchaeum chitinilyticum]
MHRSVSRYDLLLAVIALPVAIAGVLGAVSTLAMSTALAAGSVPATGGIGYALFVEEPTADAS